jgi:hypothetical protein
MSLLQFIFWFIGKRLVWVLAAGALCFVIGPQAYEAIFFYTRAIEVSATVINYGVDQELVTIPTRNGTQNNLIITPWVAVVISDSHYLGLNCTLSGQASVFGDWYSDSKLLVEKKLTEFVNASIGNLRIRSVKTHTGELLCAISRNIGFESVVWISPFLLIVMIMTFLSIKSIKKYINENQ